MYINKLDDRVKDYNNVYYSIIKIKLVNEKSSHYTYFGVENNDEDPKSKASHHGRISKYRNIFAKNFTLNWTEDVFVIKKFKNTLPWTFVTYLECITKKKISKDKSDKVYSLKNNQEKK